METESIRGSHPVMRAILAAADRIATTDACVLIIGERGTGKELLARYIHAASRRATRPFIRVDCQDLAASQGASLSAALAQDASGSAMACALLERARGGTLFLDQISALGSEQQAAPLSSLLRNATAEADLRVLAARDAAEASPKWLVGAGLAAVEIPVPALRQRRSDIPLLVEHFLELYATRHGLGPRRIENEAMVQLWQYDWPGNVRELESVVERVVVLCRSGIIRPADLPRHICTDATRPGNGTAGNGCRTGSVTLR